MPDYLADGIDPRYLQCHVSTSSLSFLIAFRIHLTEVTVNLGKMLKLKPLAACFEFQTQVRFDGYELG